MKTVVNGKIRVPIQNPKGFFDVEVIMGFAAIIAVGMIVLELANQSARQSAFKNRMVLPYETQAYCEALPDGVTLRVITPATRYEFGESIQEQWVASDKLIITISETNEARLVNLGHDAYRLELPEGATCK